MNGEKKNGNGDAEGGDRLPLIGAVEWFNPGDYDRVEQVMADLRGLGVGEIRTGISWADWCCAGGEEWYDWLLPRLSSELNLLPCFLHTPPWLARAPKRWAPPVRPKDYADFLDVMISRYGRCFTWVELWNEPNAPGGWDRMLDPDWKVFCEMIGGAAYWARHRGLKVALGGMNPVDPSWLRLMFERGVMQHVDAVGVHGFPGVWGREWSGWDQTIASVRTLLREGGSSAEVWITATGYSTWRYDERNQLRSFLRAADAPAERLYWYATRDLDPERSASEGFHADEREYHFGLKRSDGTAKLLGRLWSSGGIEALREIDRIEAPPYNRYVGDRPVLITGGSGFVGTNLAHRYLSMGRRVLLYDNLSRPGVEKNLRWLKGVHGDRVAIEIADTRDHYALRRAVGSADQVFHLAAQVAVTTSLVNPVDDFVINTRGTLNLLEAARAMDDPPSIIFTSTNKVYGGLDDVPLVLDGSRYQPADPGIRSRGIDESRPLDFHSPYGCSKGAADQYIIDYARTFGLRSAVFRMSCIYGLHQFGTEDQGWVAHFLIRAIQGMPITLYGDGMQVRDILFAEDLVDAFLLAQRDIESIAGQAFNIGGGAANTISLLELIDLIGEMNGSAPELGFDEWRPGDQRYYVSDTTKFRAATGWSPKVGAGEGVRRLYDWLLETRVADPARARQKEILV